LLLHGAISEDGFEQSGRIFLIAPFVCDSAQLARFNSAGNATID
jgi:hypothetical protein